MPLQIIAADITTLKVDAIVNAANNSLLGGGGVDGAIHRAAGIGLLQECRTLNGCKTGEAKITGGYNLPAKYVIHTVGPRWRGGYNGEQKLLESCYCNALKLAVENGCETVAFPLISSGAYGYPKDDALEVAVKTIGRFLLNNDLSVYLTIFERRPKRTEKELVQELIKDAFVIIEKNEPAVKLCEKRFTYATEEIVFESINAEGELEDYLSRADESFTEMLLRKIDEQGLSDAECYRAANVDRRLFSKIRSDKNYKPSKQTAVAFAIALRLPLDEAKELLEKAGFALSRSRAFDIIVEYYISCGIYDIHEINLSLYKYDQLLLGSANVG